MTNHNSKRLDGLDLARFLAFVGMVIVNFKIVMMDAEASLDANFDVGVDMLSTFTGLLEGKAAATFVVLAGVGLGLAAGRNELGNLRILTFRRSVFLLVIGLLNTLIFDADILHYYAFYFLFGMLCLQMSAKKLVLVTAITVVGFPVLALIFDYDVGWDWSNFTYTGFWTFDGFIRNLMFNGWHPVVPWLAFFLFGILVSRWRLDRMVTLLNMIWAGAGAAILVGLLSWGLVNAAGISQSELASLLVVDPVPPAPLFMITGMGVATTVIGFCLLIARLLGGSALFTVFTAPGRQTLTLYVAHILIGMGTMEELDMLGNQTLASSVLAALYFCLAAIIYAMVWSRFFSRGPIEMLMRKLAG